MIKLDILAFASHPDDAELSCSGVLMIEKLNGKKTGIIDLTQGELGTRGNIDTRKKEAALAAEIMQLDIRENLSMRDGFFINDEVHQLKIIHAIRKYKPEIVICNAPEDRHPDHGKGAQLIEDAAFLSGLRKISTQENGMEQEAWRPKYVFNYIQDRYLKPDFVIDITSVMERKIDSIKAYGTQFHNPTLHEPQTYISSPDFMDFVIYRCKMMGKMIGVSYGEGFLSKKMIGISSLDPFILQNT